MVIGDWLVVSDRRTHFDVDNSMFGDLKPFTIDRRSLTKW